MTTFLSIVAYLIPPSLMYAAPIIITAFGGLYSERSGVTNIALEGFMVIGAFICSITVLAFCTTYNLIPTHRN